MKLISPHSTNSNVHQLRLPQLNPITLHAARLPGLRTDSRDHLLTKPVLRQ
jgi:hypothetical protein